MSQEQAQRVTIVRMLDKRPDWQRVLSTCVFMNGSKFLAGTYNWEADGPRGRHYTAIDFRDIRAKEAFILNAESLQGCVVEYVTRATIRKYAAEESRKLGIDAREMKAREWQLRYFADRGVFQEEIQSCYGRLSAGCKDQGTAEGSKLAFLIPYLSLLLLIEQNPELGNIHDILRMTKEGR